MVIEGPSVHAKCNKFLPHSNLIRWINQEERLLSPNIFMKGLDIRLLKEELVLDESLRNFAKEIGCLY